MRRLTPLAVHRYFRTAGECRGPGRASTHLADFLADQTPPVRSDSMASGSWWFERF
jgi:hypothetical protein